ncbi:uncharacterized protein TM35_000061740, partial [Trypanosoma theileri]
MIQVHLHCLGRPVCCGASRASQHVFRLRKDVLCSNHTGMCFLSTSHYKQYEGQVVTDRAEREKSSSISFSCPECGKRFLSEANLRQHRRSRHLLPLKSVVQERLEALRESNSRLQFQLRELQKVNTSKDRSCKASSASLSHSGEV